MTVWRMAFRVGNKGDDLWRLCLRHDVAAIAYSGTNFDLSKFPQGEPKRRWANLAAAQKYSLRTLAYEVQGGDTIYVKSGSRIVGKGTVRGEKGRRAYRYDADSPVKDPKDGTWPHLVDVQWDPKFTPIKVLIGDSQLYAVRPLSRDDLRKLRRAQAATRKERPGRADLEGREGKLLKKQAKFRARNRALIEAIKAASDYRCDVCNVRFEDLYGEIGSKYIIAHHIELLAGKKGESITTANDIALLCANCHVMIHQKNPPFFPSELRKRLKVV